MEILVKGLASGYEIEHLARVFYPGAAVRQGGSTRGTVVYARVGSRRLAAGLRTAAGQAFTALAPLPGGGESPKLALSRLVYGLLQGATGLTPPWGMLTGVRPVRLVRGAVAHLGEAAARESLQGTYAISDDKYALARGIVDLQAPFLAANTPQSYSLYVSIPFCPSRCAYCSFVSRTIEREGHLVDQYLDGLEAELAAFSRLAQRRRLRLETVYVGGGTPTAISAAQLARLLAALHRHFDVAAAREFTVEAGRPDCTDREKLAVLKQGGVTRISINPQTLQDGVLARIGRKHSAADVLRCFEQAREQGHRNINMDLIAGLPGDTPGGFAASLAGLLALGPENITVHTLTHKRASNLVLDGRLAETSPAGQMLAGAYPALRGAGYSPYYLYRQKNTLENLENTGWTLPGREGLYNIFIMEETHTILAAGAGGSTKLVAQDENGATVIKRIFNHKYPADYVLQLRDVLQRKEGVDEFYARYLDTKAPG